ncbi:hypothetical protein [Achromobacter sp. UMC46]|uniref:hypothetical protein n=1 Tax=Achromobacter sp. UMC46 TaxID=1862319 RepID=UPI0015FFDB5D|nr:hypothetical protein [Achromobacter sp. UMC46]MBB1595160.1 hypothetical protein [Achromobacter sp. UMC46]
MMIIHWEVGACDEWEYAWLGASLSRVERMAAGAIALCMKWLNPLGEISSANLRCEGHERAANQN